MVFSLGTDFTFAVDLIIAAGGIRFPTDRLFRVFLGLPACRRFSPER